MGNNKTKNIILAVLVVGLVGMTITFASLTQQLNITNNQATVSTKWRVRFNETVTTSVGTTVTGTTTGASYTNGTPTVTNDQQTITGLQASFSKPGDYVEVAFKVQNEGNIAAKGSQTTINLGSLTCTNGAGSNIDSGVLSTFCGKLVKWVRHSDRVTDFTSADTLAAYSGSGNYPSIDGILRIEYPSTLTNSDINAINGGSVVVTLGDTTLHFEQDDNVTASNNSGNNDPVTPSNPYETTFDGNYTAYKWYDVTDEGYTDNGEGWYTSLNPESVAYLRTTGLLPEVCGVFGSGQSGTVCMTSSYYNSSYSSAGNYNADFEDVTEDNTYDITTAAGLQATGLKGYSLAKAKEMLNKGATSCYVYGGGGGSDSYVDCEMTSGGNCSISEDGDAFCYDDSYEVHMSHYGGTN